MPGKWYFKIPITEKSFLVCRDNQLELVIDGKETEDPQYFDFDTQKLFQEEHLYIPVLCNGWYYLIMNKKLYVINNGIIELLDVPDECDDFYHLFIDEYDHKQTIHLDTGKAIYRLKDDDLECPELILVKNQAEQIQYFVFGDETFKFSKNIINGKDFTQIIDSKYKLSWQCFSLLFFESVDQFLLVDLMNKQSIPISVEIGNQWRSKNAKFNSFLPSDQFFTENKELKSQLMNYLLNRKTSNEEFITAYELGEHNQEYQVTVEERTFEHLITYNPLVKEYWEKQVGQLNAEIECNRQLKQRIDLMAQMTTDQVIDDFE